MSQFGTIIPIGGNASFSTVTDNAGQIPVVNAGEVESFNEEVNNFFTINGHILSDANVSSGGMAPPLPAAGRANRLSVTGQGIISANFVGAATDVCGVVTFLGDAGGDAPFVLRVTYGYPYPSNQVPDGFCRAPQPVVCISPQNTTLGGAAVTTSNNRFFEVTYPAPGSTPGEQSFSYIVMYPIFGPPNMPTHNVPP